MKKEGVVRGEEDCKQYQGGGRQAKEGGNGERTR